MITAETQQTATPSIDLHTFWVSVQFKLLIPVLVSIILAVGTYQVTSVLITDKWEASSFLIRHAKNMSKQSDVPYLYLDTDINTLMETILLRENLERVIQHFALDVTAKELRSRVDINKTSKSNVIEVKVTWGDPKKAAAIADQISETFLQNYTQIQNSATEQIYQYYSKKRSLTQDELQTARLAETEFRAEHDVLDFEAQSDNLYGYLSQLELRYVDEEVKRNDLSAQLSHVLGQLRVTPSKVIISELLRTNEGNRTKALKNELEVLRKRYTEDNPKVQHLLHQISVLENEEQSRKYAAPKFDEVEYGPNPLHEDLSLRKLDLESQLYAIDGNLDAYSNSIANIRKRIEELSSLAQTHYKMMQDIVSKEDLIDKLNGRLIEANLALESNISDFDVLEKAQLPEYPKRSYRKVIAIGLSVFFGGLLTLYILLREFVNTTLKTANDLKQIEGADLAAVLPNKDEVSEQFFYAQFQLLFSEISQAISTSETKLITISSMLDGEGKSFIASEVAEQFVKQGKRVLYIESEEFLDGVPKAAMINDALYQRESLASHVPNEVYEGLYKSYFELNKDIYLDVLGDRQMHDFLGSCFARFDLVIWDVFPANQHLQLFRTITQCSEFNLLLTKSRNTPKAVMSRTIAMMNTWGIKNIGLLINALPKKYIRNQLGFSRG